MIRQCKRGARAGYQGNFITTLAILLGTLLVTSCNRDEENFDFIQEEVDRFAINFLKKKNIGIKKNIGVLHLPSMSRALRTRGKGAPPLFPYKSLDECGELCRKLYNGGFVSTFTVSKEQVISESLLEKRTAAPKFASQSFDGTESEAIAYKDYIEKYNLELKGYEEEVNIGQKKYIVIYRTQNGYFVYLSIAKLKRYAEQGEKLYGNPLVGEPYTLEGHTTWYQLFEKTRGEN